MTRSLADCEGPARHAAGHCNRRGSRKAGRLGIGGASAFASFGRAASPGNAAPPVFEMSQQSIFTVALLRKELPSIEDLFVTCRPHVTICSQP